MDFGLEINVGESMKIIIAISTLAVIGATYFYQVQNTDKVESKQTTKVDTITASDSAEEVTMVDRSGDDEVSTEVVTPSALGSELEALSAITSKITTADIQKPTSQTKINKSKKKVVTKVQPQVIEDKVSTKASGTISVTDLINNTSSKIKNKISGSLVLGANTDSKETSDDTKVYGSTMSFGVGYQINDELKASLGFSGSKDLSSSFEETIGNSTLTLSHSGAAITDRVTLAPSVTGIYPTNKDSKVRDEMIGALSVGSSLTFSVNPALALIYAPGFKNNFYKYETNRIGKSLTEYQATQSVIVSYSMTDKFSVSPSFTYINAWTHAGSERDPAYNTSLDFSYAYAEKIAMSIGGSTGGAHTITEKGPDSNLEIYDSESTSFYGNISLAF